MMGSGYGAHMMGGMWLWWIVGLGLLGLLVWVVGRTAGVPSPPGGEDSPETILKRSYARGEIDGEDYERRLIDLRK